jgi:hypothetical protein
MSYRVRLIVFSLAFMLGIVSVMAHAGGLTLERRSGPYLVDIGFDQTVIAGDEILIDFALIENPDSPDWSIKPYTLLQVGLTRNGKQVFSKDMPRQDFGKTFMVYTFPRSGDYELSARFMDRDTPLSDETFTVTVLPGQGTEIPWTAVGFAGVGIAAILAMAAYFTRRTA